MIYFILLLNTLFAQVSGSMDCFVSGAAFACVPTVIYQEESGTSKKPGTNAYSAEKASMEALVREQEKQQREFTDKYIERETTRMKVAETQAKRNLVESVVRHNLGHGSKTKHVDQFRMYVDSAESLKSKIDKYNKNIEINIRDYKTAVENAEGIIYSNISSNFPKGFTKDGIFVPESVDSSIQKSPLSDFKSSHPLTSRPGQIVRRMANQYQASWGANSFFLTRSFSETSQYLLGASYVRLADEKFSSNPMQALGYLQMAKNILSFSEGVLTGVKDNIVSIIKMAPELASALKDYSKAAANDPTYLVSSTYGLAMATPRLAAALVDHLKDQIGILENGSAYERGKVIGEYTLDILGMVASLGSSAVVSGARVGTVSVGKAAIKEFAEELAANPALQKVISKELIPAVQEAIEISNTLKNASREQYLKALELKQTLQSTGKVNVTSEAVEYSQVVATKAGNTEWNHNVLIKNLSEVSVMSGEDANMILKSYYNNLPGGSGKFQPPYISTGKVFGFKTQTRISDKFVRVYIDSKNMSGPWIVEKSSIDGLSRAQIQDKLALPSLPKFIVDVDIPAGVPMRKGVPNVIFGSSGKQFVLQYEIAIEKLPKDFSLPQLFKNPRELP